MDLQLITNKYDLGTISSHKQLSEGLVNINFLVQTEKGTFVIRQVPKYRTQEEILFEQTFIAELEGKITYKIPTPLKSINGETIIKQDKHNYWTYKFIEGTMIDEFNKEQLRETARLMAQLHSAAKQINITTAKEGITQEKAISILQETYDEAKNKEDENSQYILKEFEKINDILKNLIPETKKQGELIPIHNDITTENILFEGDKLVAVLDFEQTITASALKDITTFLQREAMIGEQLDKELVKVYLEEYRKTQSIIQEEITQIPNYAITQYVEDLCYVYWVTQNDPERDVELKHIQQVVNRIKWFATNTEEVQKMFL